MSPAIRQIPLAKFGDEPQVRGRLDPDKVAGLAASLRAVGQLQPIRARPLGNLFDPVDGHYRVAAARLAGFETIDAVIEERELNAAEILQRQLIANCQRTDLTPCETARGIEQLMSLTGWTAAQAAAHLGFSETKVSGLRKLLTLPPEILAQVEAGAIPVSTAYELARIDDPIRRAELFAQAATGAVTRDEVSGARRSTTRSAAGPDDGPSRVTLSIDKNSSVTFSGPGLTLDRIIGLSEALLAKARRGRTRGFELPTLVKMFRDQARAAKEA
ncbi:MAG: ParB/RepB/Spo0J family partition protein [Planctomycetales bacterium]|nr:ParB/RepB/Spo0J family partition protein [Planctomycetales bacterium]